MKSFSCGFADFDKLNSLAFSFSVSMFSYVHRSALLVSLVQLYMLSSHNVFLCGSMAGG